MFGSKTEAEPQVDRRKSAIADSVEVDDSRVISLIKALAASGAGVDVIAEAVYVLGVLNSRTAKPAPSVPNVV